jgi:hypothetical protein
MIDLKVTKDAQTREILKLNSPTTALNSKVPNQEPPYCKSIDQNHVLITQSSSPYPYSKEYPYEPIC